MLDSHADNFSHPLALGSVEIKDSFWKGEMELIRKEVIPYQWEALNDRVKDASPSFCMHNFRAAAALKEKKQALGEKYREPAYTYQGFEVLPEDPGHLEEKFYGFVFQDSDFYKWIEAVAYCLTWRPDSRLEKTADEAIDIVCAAQQEDGYLDTYYILSGKDGIFTNLRDHHELYCLGHLIEGAVAYYQATGKRKLLEAACRFADYTAEHFGPEEGKCKGYPGHEIAEMALMRLYEATGNKRYLDLGKFFIEERGRQPYYFDLEHPEAAKGSRQELPYQYHQAHLPVRQQREAVGHAVRAVYLYSGMADAARIFKDKELYEACRALWKDVVDKKLYITGGIGGTQIGEAFSFPYDLPNDTAYAETCAAIGLIFWARRMLQLCPEGEYADVMERALYNCVLSGMALDGKSFFYVNPLEVVPEACHQDARKAHVKPLRQKWFGCACCPPNLARLISSLGSYAYTENETTLFVHLYIGGVVKKSLGDKAAVICMESGFPWNGRVLVTVKTEKAPFVLALRIPGWGRDYSIKGAENLHREERNGYLYLSGDWSRTEKLELIFPMEIKLWQANSQVRENVGKVAVTKGPFTYCLEERDNGANLQLLTLDCSQEALSKARAEAFSVEGTFAESLLLKGYREMPSCASLYYPAGKPAKEPVTLRLIPYYLWANRGENEMSVWIRKD